LKPSRPFSPARTLTLIGVLVPFSAAPLFASDLAIGKVGPGGVKPGAQLQYTITVTNLDAGSVRDAVVQDSTPAGLVFVSNTGDCTTAFPCALPPLLTLGASLTITSTFTVPATYAGSNPILNTATVTSSADLNNANNSATAATALARVEGFYTLPPCRVLDTRGLDGPFLRAATTRIFNLRELCGLPANAIGVSFNVTITQPNAPGNLRLYPGGTAAPLASSINFAPGQTRANNGIVPVSADGKLSVTNDQPPAPMGFVNGVHVILDVNGYFAKTDAVPTLPGAKVRVRPAPEVEITFDNVSQAGVTSAKVIEFPDNRTGEVDQNLQAFFPAGSPLRALVPSVIVPSYVKALGKGGPGGTPTFVLAIVDTTAAFQRTAEFHGLEDFLLGWDPPCIVAGDRTQEPRTFYAREAPKGEPSLVEETAFNGPVFADISSGCGSNKGSGWNFSLYLTGRDTRVPLEVVRFKLQRMQDALSSLGRFITNGTVATNLGSEVAAALGSLDTAPAASLVNMTNFIGIVDGNPGAFDNSSRNVAGELVGRAQSASYILKKLGGPLAFDVRIGDNDGYGLGAAVVPDNSNDFQFILNPYSFQDRRSAAEQAATDGSQQTDVYSTVIPPLSPAFEVAFPVEGVLQSATLEIDVGGLESASFGQLGVAFNGVNQPGLLFFQDGALVTRVRQFPLSPAAIAKANADGVFRARFTQGIPNANGYVDAVAFDYFRLTGTAQP
jgi:uncharacterized repeat protein (TIGR01451 family)